MRVIVPKPVFEVFVFRRLEVHVVESFDEVPAEAEIHIVLFAQHEKLGKREIVHLPEPELPSSLFTTLSSVMGQC